MGMGELKGYGFGRGDFGRVAMAVFCVFAGCGVEQAHVAGWEQGAPSSPPQTTNTQEKDGNTDGSNGSAGAGASIAELEKCEPRGQEQSCYCPDGTESGLQLCDNTGSLAPCSGCATEGTVDPDVREPRLCPDLLTLPGCKAERHVSGMLPASILFLVDRSGSMNCNTPADGQSSEQCETEAERLFQNRPSKWEITMAGLKQAFVFLEGTGARAGLMFFSTDDHCGVHSDLRLGGVPLDLIGPSHVGLLSNTLALQSPEGSTPLVGATILAYAHLHQEAGGDCSEQPCGAPGNRFVVLITDGVDSCPDPAFDGAPCGAATGLRCTRHLLETEAPQARDVNIRTFVVGVPGSELGRGFLSELAFRGGTAKHNGNCVHGDPDGVGGDCHFDMTETPDFAVDLGQALLEISGAAMGCEFWVPPGADGSPDAVNVQYTLPGAEPVCIPKDDSAACGQGANGWQYAKHRNGNPNHGKVVLCGDACRLVEQTPGIQVDVLLGCTALTTIE